MERSLPSADLMRDPTASLCCLFTIMSALVTAWIHGITHIAAIDIADADPAPSLEEADRLGSLDQCALSPLVLRVAGPLRCQTGRLGKADQK